LHACQSTYACNCCLSCCCYLSQTISSLLGCLVYHPQLPLPHGPFAHSSAGSLVLYLLRCSALAQRRGMQGAGPRTCIRLLHRQRFLCIANKQLYSLDSPADNESPIEKCTTDYGHDRIRASCGATTSRYCRISCFTATGTAATSIRPLLRRLTAAGVRGQNFQ